MHRTRLCYVYERDSGFGSVDRWCAQHFYYVFIRTQDHLIESLQTVLSSFYGEKTVDSPDFGRIINERHFKYVMRACDMLFSCAGWLV